MPYALPVASALLLLALLVPTAESLQPVRVTFLTDCQMYSDWQSLGMIFSFKMSGQPGKVTRVMCCSPTNMAKYNPELLNFTETHVAPDMTIHPRLKDHYAAYNKPEAVIDYMDHVTPKEEYVLVLDSDMILRRPFLIETSKPAKGLGVGARYTYMIGVANELATRHIPEVAPRNDTLAGPYGRRADQVGGFFFMHRDDLKNMSHNWLKYTEDVRYDDQAYRLSGDVYATTPGAKPWISEMYGYAFGAAKANVWHRWDTESMIYPSYLPHTMPRLMHYGLFFKLTTAKGQDFSFDKHQHYNFDVNRCPPWDLTSSFRTGGVFDFPPRPSELTPWDRLKKDSMLEFYRDLLSIETINTLNAAFCDYHVTRCPPSRQLVDVCKEAYQRYHEVAKETLKIEKLMVCMDFETRCAEWKAQGECTANAGYMMEVCRQACGKCAAPGVEAQVKIPKTAPGEALLAALELQVKDNGGQAAAVTSGTTGGGAQLLSSIGARKDLVVGTPTATDIVSQTGIRSIIKTVHLPVPSVKALLASPERVIIPHRTQPPLQNGGRRRLHPSRYSQEMGNTVVMDGGQGSVKQLLLLCYRMGLTVTQVKECAKQAKLGMKYEHAVLSDTNSTTLTPGDVLATSNSEDQGKALFDLEDLTLTQISSSSPPVRPPRDVKRLLKAAQGLSVYEKVGLGLVVVALLALILPRISSAIRMRSRRFRSGLRSE